MAVDYITVSPESGEMNRQLNITLARNTTRSQRTNTVKVKTAGGIERTVSIVQEPSPKLINNITLTYKNPKQNGGNTKPVLVTIKADYPMETSVSFKLEWVGSSDNTLISGYQYTIGTINANSQTATYSLNNSNWYRALYSQKVVKNRNQSYSYTGDIGYTPTTVAETANYIYVLTGVMKNQA